MRFLIASIVPQNITELQAYQNIRELIFLVESYGGTVAEIVLQKREVHDKGKYLGDGKIQEIAETVSKLKIDAVILNAILVPGQIYDLYTVFQKVNPKIEVWDKVDLILKIFAQHANTSEARLQIELAAMRHMGPRIFGMGMEMSRQAGGIGTRGIGETNTERMKRHWKKEIKNTKDKLRLLTKKRQLQIEHRKEAGLKTVSIIGYTNSGKTSLFNLLSGKKKFAKNLLFATLESYTGKVFLPGLEKEVLFSDTIGFIRDLPPELIDAFRSTLLEVVNADLLVQVIDISDPDLDEKIQVVHQTLESLGVQDKDRVFAFNKTDIPKKVFSRAVLTSKYRHYNPVFLSVFAKSGIEKLLQTVTEHLSGTKKVK